MADKKQPDGTTITLKDVRLSFASVFRPQAMQPDKDGNSSPARYKANGLIPKEGHPTTEANLKAWKAAYKAAMRKTFGDDEAKWPKLKPNMKCVRDGDQEDWEGYEGMWYISCNSNTRPAVVGPDRRPIAEEDGIVFSGVWVNLNVRIWAQNNQHGKRVNAEIRGVQFVRKDEAFGNAPIDVDEAFEDISDEVGVDIGDDEDVI